MITLLAINPRLELASKRLDVNQGENFTLFLRTIRIRRTVINASVKEVAIKDGRVGPSSPSVTSRRRINAATARKTEPLVE
jgi:hypothetical protein